jgi:hypothetical protein
MKVSGLERAGEFGLAERDRPTLGRFKEGRLFRTRRNYSWFKRSCAQVLTLLRIQVAEINDVAIALQGPRLPIFEAPMLGFSEVMGANSFRHFAAG